MNPADVILLLGTILGFVSTVVASTLAYRNGRTAAAATAQAEAQKAEIEAERLKKDTDSDEWSRLKDLYDLLANDHQRVLARLENLETHVLELRADRTRLEREVADEKAVTKAAMSHIRHTHHLLETNAITPPVLPSQLADRW